MNKKSVAIIRCRYCRSEMKHPQRTFLPRDKIFWCTCGNNLTVSEKEYERLTGRCCICGRKDCCARDHRFNGVIPAGMGL